MNIKLLLVEDDPVWRTMLTKFINGEQDLQVTHAVATKEEAIVFCSSRQVDVVLMDINLTGNQLDGIEATLELNLMGNRPKVIALTSFEDEDIILDAYTAGVIQYVSKSEFRKIPTVIRDVLKANSPQEVLLREYLRLKEAEQTNQLTAAEKEIVTLSQQGNGRAQLMDKLGKSEGTLKNQISSILRKFKSKSMKDVVRTIKRRGLKDRELDR